MVVIFGHPVPELPGGSQNFRAIGSEIGQIFVIQFAKNRSDFSRQFARKCPIFANHRTPTIAEKVSIIAIGSRVVSDYV